jgi:hypothetical protein
MNSKMKRLIREPPGERNETMNFRMIVLAISGLTLWAGAVTDGRAKDENNEPVVKELSANGVPRVLERGVVTQPTAITSAKELVKAIPVEEVQKRLQKEVDFSKQQILFFAWSGSGGDKLTYTIDKGKKGPVVVFQYQRGLLKNLAPHVHLFAMPKDATWKVQTVK